ncbi:serine hydrolase domain-containing protein [Acidobacteriota bacterium]
MKNYFMEKSKVKFVGILICLLLITCSGTLLADSEKNLSPSESRLIAALRSYIPHVLRLSGTPGLNIALARRNKIFWEEGFGYADLEQKIPMTAQTVFHSGSMGKTYVVTSIMQLVERGVINLYDPINLYLKEFKVSNPLGEREITFYDLLTHRSGLAINMAGCHYVSPKPLGEHLKEGYSQSTFKSYKGTWLPRWSHKVGETYQYSNFGMATLGYLVEITNPEGLSFSEYVQKNIMDPLGMTSSMYPPVQDAKHIRADIFKRMSKGYAMFGPVDIPTPTIYFADYPAGTVVSIPGDHIRLLLAYMNEGTYNGYQLLKPETVQHILTPQLEINYKGFSHKGLTWYLGDINKPNFHFGHGGAHMFGWRNDFRAFPNRDLAFVIATNHWTMVPRHRMELDLIEGFLDSWMEHENKDEPKTYPEASWAWKTSYVIGLMMVDALHGTMGIEEPLTKDMVEAMANGAKVRTEAENGVSVWDPAGFRAGVEDMLSVDMTVKEVRAFVTSDRMRVAPEELMFLYKELGGRTRPFPYLFTDFY